MSCLCVWVFVHGCVRKRWGWRRSSSVSWSVQNPFEPWAAELKEKNFQLCRCSVSADPQPNTYAKWCQMYTHRNAHAHIRVDPSDGLITDQWPTANALIHSLLDRHRVDGQRANWPTAQATPQIAIQLLMNTFIHTLNWATQLTSQLCQNTAFYHWHCATNHLQTRIFSSYTCIYIYINLPLVQHVITTHGRYCQLCTTVKQQSMTSAGRWQCVSTYCLS